MQSAIVLKSMALHNLCIAMYLTLPTRTDAAGGAPVREQRLRPSA